MEGVEKRRDRHDIVAEILKIARGGKIKTHIMYKAKLSYSQINEYLQLLIDKKFLEEYGIKRRRQIMTMYRTTEKGEELLDRLGYINKLWAE